MKTLAIANLKGGSGKTTSAAYIAEAFRQRGRTVLLVDADPQGQLVKWAEQADWPIPTLGLPKEDIHKKLPGLARPYDMVVIDTPPIYQHAQGLEPDEAQRQAHGIVISALRAADAVLIPLAPTMMELEGVPRILEAIEQAAAANGTAGPAVRISLNRTVWNSSFNKICRAQLVAQGCHVLTTEIPFRQASIGQAYGAKITRQLHGYFSIAEDMETAR